MDQVKSWLQSKTVWAGIIAALSAVLGLFNINFGAEDQTAILDAVWNIVSAISGVVAVWGRVTATKLIGKSS